MRSHKKRRRTLNSRRGYPGICIACNAWATDWHHRVAKKFGGQDARSNLVPLCRFCHGLLESLTGGCRPEPKNDGLDVGRIEGVRRWLVVRPRASKAVPTWMLRAAREGS